MHTLKRPFLFAMLIAFAVGAGFACTKSDDPAPTPPEVMSKINTRCGSSTCI